MKRISLLLILLLLLAALSPTVLAQPPAVVDEADLLTDQEEGKLSSMAESLRQTYQIDVVIVTVENLGNQTPRAFADDFFDYNGYGVGENYSGVLFLLSMEYRDWYISTSGDGVQALSENDVDDLFYSMANDLSEGEYYDAFITYLEDLDGYFRDYQERLAPPDAGDYMMLLLISLAIGAVVGGIGLATMRSGMKTAVKQSGAQSYVDSSSFYMPINQNTFLYTRTNRVRIQQASSGGGSSIHRSSSGRSHGGHGGKF